MRVIIANTQVPFVRGGAEIHAKSLCDALIERGHEAEIVNIPFKWYPPERIMENLLACRLLDLTESCGVAVDRVIGLKFPAYHIQHPNKVIWALHQYRSAFDLWDSPDCDLARFPNGREIRETIDKTERTLLREARAIFANSQNVANRMSKYTGVLSTPLYHPPKNSQLFTCASAEPYFFYPSRISPLKRQELVIRALAHANKSVRVIFAGRAENPGVLHDLQQLAEGLKVAHKITWAGGISDEQLIEYYAKCRAVLYTPLDEDYGYVTLEAMLSSKPVITCVDSGGPLEFITHETEGWIAQSTPEHLAQTLDKAWIDPVACAHFGETARTKIMDMNINWDNVVSQLLA